MPLDITLFRKEGGNPELIRESQRRRFQPVEIVDEIIALDDLWRGLTGKNDNLRKARNAVQKEIAACMKGIKTKNPAEHAAEIAELNAKSDALMVEKNRLDKEIEDNEILQIKTKEEVEGLLNTIGNIVLDSVPVSLDEDRDNRVERRWGTPRDPAGLLSHHDLLWRIGGYEPERGTQVAGHRGYFLKDAGVLLNQAFINYGITFLRQRSYSVLQPPYMMRKEVMAGVAQLSQFDEELYKVSGGPVGEGNESGDKYLIATSEQPICAYHKDDWLEEKALPLRYAGISTCFRKEAGKHGQDTWGIFRVHQFEKVEQFTIVEGDLEVSNAMQDEMIAAAEEFYQSLGFPYQVINIVSGALNNAAIRKFDLECWFPGYNSYRELVSCSNCTDYQSRPMGIRCGVRKMGEVNKKYVHMLNATLCATGRAICCLLETYQEADGVRIPEVLVPFMGGITFLPFVRESRLDGGKDKEKSGKAADGKEKEKVAPKSEDKAPAASTPAAGTAAPVDKKDGKKQPKEKGVKKEAKPAAPVYASIPTEIRPPPAYVTAAPTNSSQSLVVPTLAEALVGNEVNLRVLNSLLKHFAYASGDTPGAADQKLFEQLKDTGVNGEEFKNVARWLRCLAAVPAETRATWI